MSIAYHDPRCMANEWTPRNMSTTPRRVNTHSENIIFPDAVFRMFTRMTRRRVVAGKTGRLASTQSFGVDTPTASPALPPKMPKVCISCGAQCKRIYEHTNRHACGECVTCNLRTRLFVSAAGCTGMGMRMRRGCGEVLLRCVYVSVCICSYVCVCVYLVRGGSTTMRLVCVCVCLCVYGRTHPTSRWSAVFRFN